MGKKAILIIDDDETLVELFQEYVRSAGFEVHTCTDGRSGLQIAASQRLDLVVLDVMMPGMDGWEVCQTLRQSSRLPIIMLTAKGDEIDKLRGFHLGVDDYVTKPFSFAELVARIKAVLARSAGAAQPGPQLARGDLKINFAQRRVTVSGETVDLSPTEFQLLEALARRPERTIPTEQLLLEVWGQEYAGENEYVKRYIWALRKKIERDPGDPQHIITERGFGYRFE